MDHKDLIKVTDAAEILNEHRNNIYWYISQDQLKKFIIGGNVFVSRQEVEKMRDS